MTRRTNKVKLLLAASSFLSTAVPTFGAQWNISFRTLDFPGATRTEVNGINSARGPSPLRTPDIVGTFYDISGPHGFLYSRGQFTRIDAPSGYNTEALGINDQGQIVGRYQTGSQSNLMTASFVRTAGTFTQISVCSMSGVQAHGINNAGQIVGSIGPWSMTTGRQGFLTPCYGFVWPGSPQSTELWGINNVRQRVGNYVDKNGVAHGGYFSELIGGSGYRTYDVPGASQTWLRGVNDAHYTVGYILVDNALHGFLNDQQNVTRIDYPGGHNTRVLGVNNLDTLRRQFSVVGSYVDSANKTHGFTASLSPRLVVGSVRGAK